MGNCQSDQSTRALRRRSTIRGTEAGGRNRSVEADEIQCLTKNREKRARRQSRASARDEAQNEALNTSQRTTVSGQTIGASVTTDQEEEPSTSSPHDKDSLPLQSPPLRMSSSSIEPPPTDDLQSWSYSSPAAALKGEEGTSDSDEDGGDGALSPTIIINPDNSANRVCFDTSSTSSGSGHSREFHFDLDRDQRRGGIVVPRPIEQHVAGAGTKRKKNKQSRFAPLPLSPPSDDSLPLSFGRNDNPLLVDNPLGTAPVARAIVRSTSSLSNSTNSGYGDAFGSTSTSELRPHYAASLGSDVASFASMTDDETASAVSVADSMESLTLYGMKRNYHRRKNQQAQPQDPVRSDESVSSGGPPFLCISPGCNADMEVPKEDQAMAALPEIFS